MRSEGFPFIVWGSGGWTFVRLEWLVASSSRRRRVVNSVSVGGATKPLLFEGFLPGCHVVLRGTHGTLWHSNLFDSVSKVYESIKIGGSLARTARFAAPTRLVSSLWFSCGVAVSMGEAAKNSPFRRFPSTMSCHFVVQSSTEKCFVQAL